MKGAMKARTILIVDDQKEIVQMLERHLAQTGYNVLCAYNGDQALQIVRKVIPDLVLLDITMPRKDGWEFCREVFSNRKLYNFPILVMSGRGELESVFQKIEVDGFIAKPFEIPNLLIMIERLLQSGARRTSVLVIDSKLTTHSNDFVNALDRHGYHVLVIDKLEALTELHAEFKPAVILAEYVRHETSGEAFIHSIKKIFPGTPLIAYSLSGMNFREKSIEAGAACYVHLPNANHFSEILEAVSNVVNVCRWENRAR